jgi:hypothetical protein
MKVEYKFDPFKITGLDDSGLTKKQKKEILDDIADLVLTSVLDFVGSSKSPVTGDKFQKLKPEYKKIKLKEGGTPVANLELHGDMLDSLKVKNAGDELILTVSKDQMPKADNHNKFSPESKKTPVPARKFIPNADEDETFTKVIIKEIKSHIKDKIDEFQS